MAGSRPLRVGLRDAGLLAALHEGCFRPSGDEVWDRTSITGLLATPGTFAFVATEIRGAPAGLLIGRHAGDEAEILTLGVLPRHRRAGHGRALVESAARHVAGQGAETLHLEVAADNTAASELYARCGFRVVGCRPDYYRRGSSAVDAIHYRRTLAELAGKSD